MDIEGSSIYFDEDKPDESLARSIEETLPNITAMNLTNYSTSALEPAIGKGRLDVQVRMNLSKPGFEMASYPMTANPRGRALIVEIQSYQNDIETQRIGSHHDVENLKALFSKLGFVVSVSTDLTKSDLENKLKSFAELEEHKAADMMILVILSHGQDGYIITNEGKRVILENIFQQFNNLHCPNLKGKPKFFIIQACRGELADKVIQSNQDDDEHSKFPTAKKRRNPVSNDSHSTTRKHEYARKGPTWEDFIIAYSTIPGYVSNRDPEKGTWFIQSLVEIFSYHAIDKELIDLLRMTSERLSQFENDENEKQTCNIEMRHLYKRIYFQPQLFKETQSLAPSPALRRSKSNPSAPPRRELPQSDQEDDFFE